jgi:hypothetical protein
VGFQEMLGPRAEVRGAGPEDQAGRFRRDHRGRRI